MRSNVGQADQIVRGVVGASLIILTGLGALDGVWRVVAVVVGSIGVFTGSAAFCPLYRLLSITTVSRRQLTS
jgi:hypothetical protein